MPVKKKFLKNLMKNLRSKIMVQEKIKRKLPYYITFSFDPEKYYKSFSFWNEIQMIEYYTKRGENAQ